MPEYRLKHFTGAAGSPQLLRDRIVKPDGSILLPSESATFNISIFATSEGGSRAIVTTYSNLTTTPSDANDGKLYTSLQTDVLLDDGSGYNFKYVIRPTLFESEGNRVYLIEFKFNTSDSSKGPQFSSWAWHTSPVLGNSL
jgi:hypothetical protein